MERIKTSEGNKYIFYGIVLFFIILQIVDILDRLLNFTIGVFEMNLFFIPVLMSLFCIGIIYYTVFCMRKFPTIKPLFIVAVIIIKIIIVNMVSENDLFENYSKEDIGLKYAQMTMIEQMFIYIYSIAMYIKYYRINKIT